MNNNTLKNFSCALYGRIYMKAKTNHNLQSNVDFDQCNTSSTNISDSLSESPGVSDELRYLLNKLYHLKLQSYKLKRLSVE